MMGILTHAWGGMSCIPSFTLADCFLHIDQTTSSLSTSPYSAEQCNKFINMLDRLRGIFKPYPRLEDSRILLFIAYWNNCGLRTGSSESLVSDQRTCSKCISCFTVQSAEVFGVFNLEVDLS